VFKGGVQRLKYKGRSRVEIHLGRAEIFQVVRSQRSSALVICEELSEFHKTKGLVEAE
jgi:hypothetical protein